MRGILTVLLSMIVSISAGRSQTIATLASFDGSNGAGPEAGLIIDPAGNLFGTTTGHGLGAPTNGTVFEIPFVGGVYAGTPATLVSFNGANGASPYAGLVLDTTGNLFGTTVYGGSYGNGTVFEVAKTGGIYASTPTTLINFSGASTSGANPYAGLIADPDGNLFGTTSQGGANNAGAVFEIARTDGTYSSTPAILASFNGTNGASPHAGLFADAAGNLFGTTYAGGANGMGTVFEVAKTGGTYAGAPSTLVNFNGTNGNGPVSGVIADAAGNLVGTTAYGGANGVGTVFEIAYDGSYAGVPTTLASFTGSNGQYPNAGLIADAAGDLFGTTTFGGTHGYGTVFEIPFIDGSYASTPIILINFDYYANGAYPYGDLIADAAGDLFGTADDGGPGNDGTVFEITNSGFVTSADLPEPATLAMFGPGIAGLGLVRRRKGQINEGRRN